MYCSNCGKEISEDKRFCSNCGQKNESYIEKEGNGAGQVPPPPQPNSYIPPQNAYGYYNPPPAQPQYYAPQPKKESGAIGVLAIIFSILGGWLGLILSVVGLCTYKDPVYQTQCKVGLGFSIFWFVIYVIMLASL